MIQKDTLTIKTKADATPALIAQLKGDDKKDGCAGTFHTVGECVLPCSGQGYVIRRFEQTTYSTTLDEHKQIIGTLKESLAEKMPKHGEGDIFGEVNPGAKIDTTVCRPLAIDICPCKKAARLDEYQEGILRDLGLEKIPTLSAKQSKALEDFKARKSLYIYGATGQGKTTLAAACALTYQRGVKVLKGEQLKTELTRMAMNNEPPKFSGLWVLDDIGQIMPSEAMRGKLFLIFDAARAGKGFRLIVTAQQPIEEICEKFCVGDKQARDAMLIRLSALTEVKLP